MQKNTLTIADPLTQTSSIQTKNRLYKSAMSEQLGDSSHNPSAGLIRVFNAWAKGGIGIAVTGNVMIDRSALGEPKNVVLDTQSDMSKFKNWASAGKQNGCKIWMQLNHPGKQIPSYLCKEPVAPSAVPLGDELKSTFNEPRALTETEIEEIISKFAFSARAAKECGFDGVQIHGAHGYLVNQFLSARHNHREDPWGGSIENRMRFVVEIYKAIRKAVGPNFPIGIKLNSADYMKGGFTPEESMQVLEKLGNMGIDLIEISGGTYESPSMVGDKVKASTKAREAYFLDYAESARTLVKALLVVTGGFRSTQAMNAALQSGATDFIGLARPIAIDPEMPNKALADTNYSALVPSPSTGIKTLDRMMMLSITWFESQIARTAKGKQTKLTLSPWVTIFEIFLNMGLVAFKPRRAK